jgi:hypothetical protein
MRKEDLKVGNIVELRSGVVGIVIETSDGVFVSDVTNCRIKVSSYTEELLNDGGGYIGANSYDVMKVGTPTSTTGLFKDVDWIWERKKPFMFEGTELKVGDVLWCEDNKLFYKVVEFNGGITFKIGGILLNGDPIQSGCSAFREYEDLKHTKVFTRQLPTSTREMTVKEIEEALGHGVKVIK